jgi:hypothetical protein
MSGVNLMATKYAPDHAHTHTYTHKAWHTQGYTSTDQHSDHRNGKQDTEILLFGKYLMNLHYIINKKYTYAS